MIKYLLNKILIKILVSFSISSILIVGNIYPNDDIDPIINKNSINTYPSSGWYTSDPGNVINVDFYDYDSKLNKARYQIDSQTAVDIATNINNVSYTTNWGVIWGNLAEGDNTVYIVVFDNATNYALDSITIKRDSIAPNKPLNLNITDPIHDGVSLYLTWSGCTDATSGIAKYIIYEATDINFTQNVFCYETTNTYLDAIYLTAGQVYYYKVVAIDNAGNWSQYSDVSNKTPSDTKVPLINISEPISYVGSILDPDDILTINYTAYDESNNMTISGEVFVQRFISNVWTTVHTYNLTQRTGQIMGSSYTQQLSKDDVFVNDRLYVEITATDPSDNSYTNSSNYYTVGYTDVLIGAGDLRWPLSSSFNNLTSVFGEPRRTPYSTGSYVPNRFHSGIDISADLGSNIYCIDRGWINNSVFGTTTNNDYILVNHNSSLQSKYLHLSDAVIYQKNQLVYKNEIIAATGYPIRPHLHYNLIDNSVYINPLIESRQAKTYNDTKYPKFNGGISLEGDKIPSEDISLEGPDSSNIYKPVSSYVPKVVKGDVNITIRAMDYFSGTTDKMGIYSAAYYIEPYTNKQYSIEFKKIHSNDYVTNPSKLAVIYGTANGNNGSYHEYKLFDGSSGNIQFASGTDLVSGKSTWDTLENNADNTLKYPDGKHKLKIEIKDILSDGTYHTIIANIDVIVDNYPLSATCDPPDGAAGISPNTNITIKFSEPIKTFTTDGETVPSSYLSVVEKNSTPLNTISGTAIYFNNDNSIKFLPWESLKFNRSYDVRLTGIKDLTDATLGNQLWTFTTENWSVKSGAIKDGLTWLAEQAISNSSEKYWTFNSGDPTKPELAAVGLTGMVLLAYLNDPNSDCEDTNGTVLSALKYLKNRQKSQSGTPWNRGAIATDQELNDALRTGLHVYETSTALWALLAAKKRGITQIDSADIDPIITNAASFLVRAQRVGPDMLNTISGTAADGTYGLQPSVNYDDNNHSNKNYGGWGYPARTDFYAGDTRSGQLGNADLSNTQFALFALKCASDAGLAPDWTGACKSAAKIYLTNCRNDHSDSLGSPAPTFSTAMIDNDEGYIYRPYDLKGWWGWGMGKSYASITAAGIWSAWCLGVDINDTDYYSTLVGTPKQWFQNNWYTSKNVNINGQYYGGEQMWYYYYLMTAARAFSLYGWTNINYHDWYEEFSDQLINGHFQQNGPVIPRHNSNGSWSGFAATVWGGHIEGESDIMATAEAILTLQTQSKNNDDTVGSWILGCESDLHLYDKIGRHVGKNYVTNEIETQIPGSSYVYDTVNKKTIISVRGPDSGQYTTKIFGQKEGTESFTLTAKSYYKNQLNGETSVNGAVAKNEIKEATSFVTTVVGPMSIVLNAPVTPSAQNHAPTLLSININPNAPNASNNIICSVNVSDQDLDPVTLSYNWYRNGDYVFTDNTTSNQSTLPSSYIDLGDTWKCSVTCYDGKDSGNSLDKEVLIHSLPSSNIGDLSANSSRSDEVNLAWTSPGKDGNSGTITSGKYAIQYSSVNVFWAYQYAQIIYDIAGITPGIQQTYTVKNLALGSTYYFHIWTQDEEGSWSDISNTASIYLRPSKEFVCTIKETGGDYTSLSSWNTAIKCDLVHSTGTRVFSHSGITVAIPDDSTVTGAVSGATGILCHATNSQVLIKNIDGIFQGGENVNHNSNSITLTDGGSSAIAVAKIDGEWTVDDTSKVNINGWDTAVFNYVKIYTSPAARHKGVWDNTKYRLSGTFNSDGAINLYTAFVKVDGLQVENKYSAADINGYGIRDYYEGKDGEHEISNCIIRYSGPTVPEGSVDTSNDIGYPCFASPGVVKIWNNIITNWGFGFGDSILYAGGTYYLYNNTFVDNTLCGIRVGNAQYTGCVYFKNNLVQGTALNYFTAYTYINQHSNNISQDNTSPDGESWQNKVVSFIDKINGNFLLTRNNPFAIDIGVDLSNDPYIAFNYDIQENNRPGGSGWDIGASEMSDYTAPASIADLSANNGVNIDESVLSWTAPGNNDLTDTLNSGSHYKIQYSILTDWEHIVWSTASAQITISTSNVNPGDKQSWTVRGLPQGVTCYFRICTVDEVLNCSGVSNLAAIYINPPVEFVSTIKQSGGDYTSLNFWNSAVKCDLVHSTGTRVFAHGGEFGTINDNDTVWGAISGSTGTVLHITSTQIMLRDIKNRANSGFIQGEQVYSVQNSNYVTISDGGSGAVAVAKIDGSWTAEESAKVNITGWETSARNYIKIYTTVDARHNGRWDINKYRLSGTANSDGIINIYEAFVRIDGLQVENKYSAADINGYGIRDYYEGKDGEHEISNCIIRYSGPTVPEGSADTSNDIGYPCFASPGVVKLWNNIITNWGFGFGDSILYAGGTYYLYNNTFVDNTLCGIRVGNAQYTGCVYFKNNLVQGTALNYFTAYTYINQHSNNISQDNTSPDGESFQGKTVSFVSAADGYFHLSSTDTAAQDHGIDLSNDPYIAFNYDIQGDTRPEGSTWDIGADEMTDFTAPAEIANLSASQFDGTRDKILLTWSAPGENGNSGSIIYGHYAIQESTYPEIFWNRSNAQVEFSTRDVNSGSFQQYIFSMSSIVENTTVYFHIWTADYSANWSGISNGATFYITGINPGIIMSLTALPGIENSEVSLNWIAPGDDEYTGTLMAPSQFKIQYSTVDSYENMFWNIASAQVTISTTNINPGEQQVWLVTGLEENTKYYFRIWTSDDMNNWSGISDVATFYVSNTHPGVITTLVSISGFAPRTVDLSWIAPGDDGYSGILISSSQFRIQYSTYTNWQNIVWSTADANIIISTNNVIPGSLQDVTITGLTEAVTYYFRIWTADEKYNCSDISNGATYYVMNIPPGAITTLTASQNAAVIYVNLSWFAPGNDGYLEKLIAPSQFKIQYSTFTDFLWDMASAQVTVSTDNVNPGDLQNAVITGLTEASTYYFRIWTADNLTNWSEVSNTAIFYIRNISPGMITTLAVLSGAKDGTVDLSWLAPGDDEYLGNLNTPSKYLIQYSTSWQNIAWSTANANITISTDNVISGSLQSITITGLSDEVTCYFRIWTTDDVQNWSEISNGATWYWGPREFISTIMQNGGDYSSLSSWNTAIKCDLVHSTGTRVFSHTGIIETIPDGSTVWGAISGSTGTVCHVTSSQILLKNITGVFIRGEQVFKTRNANYVTIADAGSSAIAVAKIEGSWTSGESAKVNITGWKTSARNYIKIYTTGDARHKGKWGTTKYRLSGTAYADGLINIYEAFVHVDGLQIENDSLNGYGIRDYYSSSPSGVVGLHEVSNCILKYSGTAPTSRTNWAMSVNASTVTYKIWNNICYNWSEGITLGWNYATYYIYNNTMYQCDKAPNSEGAFSRGGYFYMYFKNNLMYGTTACIKYSFSGNARTYVHSNNITSDNTSPDTAFRNKIPNFVNSSSDNFLLAKNNTVAVDSGTPLSIDSDNGISFATDIEGDSRPFGNAWDIGADEFTDFIAPAAIADLHVSTCTTQGEIDLVWTSPGDDGTIGTVTNGKFKIQYSTFTGIQWGYQNAQVVISTTCEPSTSQFCQITGLTIESTYYIRIWTCDGADNYSDLSNGATAWADVEGSRGIMAFMRPTGLDPTFRLGEVYSYPNPAKGGIKPTIHAELGIADSVDLKIYNIAGELVHSADLINCLTVVNNKYAYEYKLDINGIASGVYIYYINAKHRGDNPIKVLKKLAIIK